jgi:hypothetical protein
MEWSIELLAAAIARDEQRGLPPQTRCFVPLLDADGVEQQRAALQRLRVDGLRPVPHIVARKLRDADQAARLAQRPTGMQGSDYRLPADVESFVRSLFRPHEIRAAGYFSVGLDVVADDHGIEHAYLSAYMEGCRQGYIEGKVADLEPKRQRSRKANAAKRQKRQDCGGQMMTLDERDAAIVAEYPTLRKMLGSIEAQLRLAEKYGLSSREQVGNIIRKAKQNGTA